MRNLVKSLVVISVIAGLAVPTEVLAYNAYNSHKYTVKDALHYMYNRDAGINHNYPNGWTAKWDFYVARWWSGQLGASEQAIVDGWNTMRNNLANDTAYVDYYEDLAFHLGAWTCQVYLDKSYIYDLKDLGRNIRFTSMSHFLNAPWGADYWDVNGYYYPWTNRTGEDKEAMDTGGWSIFDVDWCDVEIRNDKSPAYFWRYADPNRQVSDEAYVGNARVEIRHARFNPSDNMAAYGWRAFLGSRAIEPGTRYLPAAKWQLGRVFHAVGDATVPHHATGLMGEEHQLYEDCVETPYVTTWKVYDAGKIREHLERRPFLDTRRSVEEIITGIARYVVQAEQNAGRQDRTPPNDFHPGGQCWPRLIDYVNLAIAGNIVILRKAWIEWGTKYGHTTGWLDRPSGIRAAGPGDLLIRQVQAQEEPIAHPPSTEPPIDLNLDAPPIRAREAHPDDIIDIRDIVARTEIQRDFHSRDPSSFLASAFARRLETADRVRRGQLLDTIAHLRNVVADLGSGVIDTDRFASELRTTDGALVDLFVTLLPTEQQIEPEGEPPIKGSGDTEDRPPIGQEIEPFYRLPTVEEVENPERWAMFAREYEKYGNSVRLVQLSIARAMLRIELSRTVDGARRERLGPTLDLIDRQRMHLADELSRRS